ncbi:MAG: hypothetical protein ABSE15_00415 [Candidatus Bathyarchaeia archaeon]
MKQWKKAALAALLVLVVGIVGFVGVMDAVKPDWLNLASSSSSSSSKPTPPPIGSAQSQVVVSDKGYSSLNIATSYVDTTNYIIAYYSLRNGNYVPLGTGSGSATITTIASDNGYVYACVYPASGQSIYIDAATTVKDNPCVVSYSYFDIANSGYPHFVFKITVQGLPVNSNGQSLLTFYPYFIPYATPSLSTLSDISGIGTGATTQYLQWQATFSAAGTGFAVTKVTLTLNTTDTTQINLMQINIPGMQLTSSGTSQAVGYLSGSSLGAPTIGATTMYWTWAVTPYNPSAADYLTLSSNQLNQFPFTTEVQTTLSYTDTIQATLTIYGQDMNGVAVSPITSSVLINQ